MLKISDNKQYLMRDGKKFFYLADTVWSIFTNTSLEEFKEYLEYRRFQGYNALQINILTQWDRSGSDIDIHPFERDEKGNYDFYKLNDAYFDRAEEMLALAVGKGFIPNLVVLWGNYVKDTWISERVPETEMPLEAIKPYITYAVQRFSKFNPMYMISGDTDFRSGEAVKRYLLALETIKEITPEALCTLHLTPSAKLPDEIVSSPWLDYYMYQSGHGMDQSTTCSLPEYFMSLPVKRPLLNGEPCYEGIGEMKVPMRFGPFHLRRATWHSLLNGAKIGITYGAHGIWNWHKKGKDYYWKDVFCAPYDWRTILYMQGAWDLAFAKQIFEEHDLFDLMPADRICSNKEEIRMSMAGDESRFAIYAPYAADITVKMNLEGYELLVVNLEDRYFGKPEIICGDTVSIIKMMELTTDVLILGRK